jgi:hypothetical protein
MANRSLSLELNRESKEVHNTLSTSADPPGGGGGI